MKSMKKTIALAVAIAMIFGCVVGGSLAWLMDNTAAVKNTFTYGDINIELTESKDLDLKMVPGKTITKDPVVTVEANSEACWLFIEIEKSANYGDYLAAYVPADGWMALDGVEGVYYQIVDAATAKAGATYPVLANNQVKVLTTVEKDDMEAIKNNPATAPTLTFTAYAVQSADLADANGTAITTAEGAWALAKPAPAAE